MPKKNKTNKLKSNKLKSNKLKSNKLKSNKLKNNKLKSNKLKSNKLKFHKTKTHKKNKTKKNNNKNSIISRIYTEYANYINQIINNDKTQWKFKSDVLYTDILEHISPYTGIQYFIEIKKNFYGFYKHNLSFLKTLCNTNDLYGKPRQIEYKNFTKCSSTNLRYILHSLIILSFMKKHNLNKIDIIEIGGGYGGLSFFLHNISKLFNIEIKSYCIFDLLGISLLQEAYLKALNSNHNMNFYQINNYKNLQPNSFLISNYAFSEISMKLQKEYTDKILNKYIGYGFLVWNFIPIYEFIDNKIIFSELEYPDTSGGLKTNFYVKIIPKSTIKKTILALDENIANEEREKQIEQKREKRKLLEIGKNKSIRIIKSDETQYNKNDLNVYIEIFKKYGYKIDIHILMRDKLNKINIKYLPNSYYDINLFIDIILPISDYYNKQNYSFFKAIFPSGINMFAPNINTFINYKQMHFIDIVLCNTQICYDFINQIKKENNYKYQYYYTKFTTVIPKDLLDDKYDKYDKYDKDDKIIIHNFTSINPNDKKITFIHIADDQKHKNTSMLIHCWLKYKNNIMNTQVFLLNVYPELHVICNGLCFTNLLFEIKMMYDYDLLNKYKFEKIEFKSNNQKKTYFKYNNLYLYLDLTPNDKEYKELIIKSNVSIYPSKIENYAHNINMSRYLNIFTITMNSKPMNELIIDKDETGNKKNNINGYLLKDTTHYKTNVYKDTKFKFIDAYPDIDELRDSIIWSITNMFANSNDFTNTTITEKNYILNNTESRKQFYNDKKYFENSMKNILQNIKYKTPNMPNMSNMQFNTLSTVFSKPTYKFYPENEDDNYCKYINIRGIVKSCDIHSLNPISSIPDLIGYDLDYSLSKIKELRELREKEIKRGKKRQIDKMQIDDNNNNKNKIYSIYVCNTAIPKFAEKIKNKKDVNKKDVNNIDFNNLDCRFILVSGDSDDTCPNDLFDNDEDFKEFIENDLIIHWYAQNFLINHKYATHKKMSQIPIGLAYHHQFNEDIKEQASKIVSPMKQEEILNSVIYLSKMLNLPFWNREVKCYINFNNNNYIRSRYGYDRYEAITKIPQTLIFSEDGEVSRNISWNTQVKYAFVVSPFGNGYDCHRTWEALILGCIPIVKKSGLDSLYEDLPVLIVQDWSDITEKLLNKVIADFKIKHEKGGFKYNKLTLKYWMDKINSHK